MARKKTLTEDEHEIVRGMFLLWIKMMHKERVKLRKDVAGLMKEAWKAVKYDSDGPLEFDDSAHRQRTNIILPAHLSQQ